MSDVPESKPARCRHSHEEGSSDRKTDGAKAPARKPSKTPSQASSSRSNNSSKGRQVSQVPEQHSHVKRLSVTSETPSQKHEDYISEDSISYNQSVDEVSERDPDSYSNISKRSGSNKVQRRDDPSSTYSMDSDFSGSVASVQRSKGGRSVSSRSSLQSDGSRRSSSRGVDYVDGSIHTQEREDSQQFEPSENASSQFQYSDDEEVDAPDTDMTAVFSSFVQALQEETHRLEDADNLGKFESSHVRGILGELAETLRDSEDQSMRLFEGIEAIREAAQGLKKTLEARLNRSTDAEAEALIEEQKNTDNKKAHSRAVAAVSAAKALLAEVALDVTATTKMAAEAESAAAEAAAAAESAAEEIGEIEETLDEAGKAGEDGEEEEGDVGEELEVADDEDKERPDSEDDDDDVGDDNEEHPDEDAKSRSSLIPSRQGEGDDADRYSPDEELEDEGEKEKDDDEDEDKEDGKKDEESPKPPPSPKRKQSIKENMLEWPYHILNTPGDDVNDDEIGCIVRFKEDYFTASTPEFRCVVNNHLSTDAVGDSEELVSHVVTVEHADSEAPGQAELEVPIVVAIPYAVSSRMASSREFVVKFRGGNEEGWKVIRMLMVDSSFAEHKGPFAEVRTSHLGSFAVVARLIQDRLTITKKGGIIKSSSDSRMNVSYPPGICSLMSVTLQLQPADHAVSDLRARMRHCSDLIAASPIISLGHSPNKPFEKPVTVTIPCPPNPLKVPATGTAGSANAAASAAGPPAKPSERHAPLSPDGAVIIRGTKSSIFGGDPAEDTLHLMHRQSNWNYWNEVEEVQFKQVRKDLVSIEVDKPMDKLLVLRMTSDGRFPPKNVAQTFEKALQIKYASIILQHREDDHQRVVVQCVPTRQLESALRRLGQEGYEGPPEPSATVAMTEGQEITLRFTGNIRIVGKDQITFTFHSQRRNSIEFLVEETNKFGNHSSDEYRGVAEFYGTPRITLADMEDPEEVLLREAEAKAAEKDSKRSGASVLTKSDKKKQEAMDSAGREYQILRKVEPDLICKLAVTLPKAEQEPPLPPSRYRATAIDAGGSVSNTNLRWLALELGNEWESLAFILGIKRSRLQSIKRNNPIKVEQQILDMLVTWRSMLPRAYDKERKLCRALVKCGRYDLAEELKERDASSSTGSSTTTNNNLNVLDIDGY